MTVRNLLFNIFVIGLTGVALAISLEMIKAFFSLIESYTAEIPLGIIAIVGEIMWIIFIFVVAYSSIRF